jgi:hypothetical protein
VTEISHRRLFIIVLSLTFAAFTLNAATVFPNGIVEDDGYFYSKIAYNIGIYQFSSFDGVLTTSGYHLLWAWLLAGISWAIGIVTPALAVHLFAHLAAFYSLILLASWEATRRPIAAIAVAALLLTTSALMETGLLALLLALIFQSFLAQDEEASIGAMALPTALVPLVRIDASIVIVVLILYLLIRARRSGLILVAALGVGCLAQFVLMQLIFGEFYSVSSFLKASQDVHGSGLIAHLKANIFASAGQVARFACLGVLGACSLITIMGAETREQMLRRAIIVVSVLAFFIPLLVLANVRTWYFVVPFLGLATVACQPFQLTRTRPATPTSLAFGLAVLFVLLNLAGRVNYYANFRSDQLASAELIRTIGRSVPAGDRIYQIDGSGFVGYFGSRTLINGDGLVNSYDYARRLLAKTLTGYLEEMGICYIVTNSTEPPDTDDAAVIRIGGMTVRGREVEHIYARSDPNINPYTKFNLYRLRRADCQDAG